MHSLRIVNILIDVAMADLSRAHPQDTMDKATSGFIYVCICTYTQHSKIQ